MEDLEKMAFTPDNSWLKSIELDKDRSPIPIYEQISNAFVNAMEKDLLKKGDVLPSINQLSSYFDVSRSTIEKAFNELRKKNHVESAKGKAYFVSETPKGKGSKVLILINNQNNFNKLIYNSFLESITSNAKVDCFVYNNNARLFSRLQEKKNLDYTDFVVIPHVVDDFQNMFTKINNLPQNKLAILQQFVNEISNDAKSSNF